MPASPQHHPGKHGAFRHYRSLLLAAMMFPGIALAQRAPRIGYVYPAGGQQGTEFEVVVGGQYLDDPDGAVVSGGGVSVEIIGHDKPPQQQAINDIRENFRRMQAKMRGLRMERKLPESEILPTIRRLLAEAGLTEKDLRHLAEYDRKRNDPKQQLNAQIAETVRVKVTIARDADPGLRYWRLGTARGLSNPMRFIVGQHPEIRQPEPEFTFDFEHYNGAAASPGKKRAGSALTPAAQAARMAAGPVPPMSLPVTINGRILPGKEDTFLFHAKKGEQIVIAVQARNLIPYLPDAVPGWFQAVASLEDASGREVAYADGYRFDPDPVLFYKIQEDGDYRVRVRDSIYRGREDFVYRITVGELPFLTGISPLGTSAGTVLDITFQGGNIGDRVLKRYSAPGQAGIIALRASRGSWLSNPVPFQIDILAEDAEHESNNTRGSSNEFRPPVVVNGRIDAPGDADFFRIKGQGNKTMVFEVFARRLGSPLDSSLAAFDTGGDQIGFNDDHEDLAAGLTTHHADSRFTVKLPPTGECFVRVTDTQNQGGPAHAYRLRIAPARPGFALRVTPSAINARPGGTARLTVHALRSEGFEGEIALQLKGAPDYVQLKNAKVPAGQDRAEISLGVSSSASEKLVALTLQGKAELDGHALVIDAVPAEDMMQAFIYRHLVPVDALLLDVRTPADKPAAGNR